VLNSTVKPLTSHLGGKVQLRADQIRARLPAAAMALALGLALFPGAARAAEPGSTVLAWGTNRYGEVGDGTTTKRDAPVELPGLHDISDVAAGYDHSLALRSDGRVLAWGSNLRGQLGDPSTLGQIVRTPTLVPGLTQIVSIDAYLYSNVAVDAHGTVWEWGQGFTDAAGGTRPVGPLLASPTPVQPMAAMTATAGMGHRLGVSYGTARGWGVNESGEQGTDTTWLEWRTTPGRILDEARGVGGGLAHTLILREDRTVWSVGRNDTGQLGDGTVAERHTPARIAGLTNIVAVEAADRNSMVLRVDGTLWSWGDRIGALGLTSFPPGYSGGNVLSPAQITAVTGVSTFDLGGLTAAAINVDGVWSWGRAPGIPGLDWSDPRLLPGTAGATDVARGFDHGLIVLNGASDPAPPVLPPPASTTVTVEGPAAVGVDQPVSFSATVTPNPGGGTVMLSTNGVHISSEPLDPVTGTATLWGSFSEERTYPLVISFPAVSGFESSSKAFELKVGRTPTTTQLSVSPANPVDRDSPVTVTARVTPIPDDPAGIVLYVDGRWTEGVYAESGVAVFTVGSLSSGPHSLVAEFIGNANFVPSRSEPYTVIVGGATTTSLSAAPANRALLGTAVTFTVQVDPADASGTVDIVDGTSVLGTIDLTTGNTLTTNTLAAGVHSIRARFVPTTPGFDPSESVVLSYEIFEDKTAPTGTITIQDSDGYTAALTVPLAFSATDAGGSGLAFVEVSRDGETWERRSWPLETSWPWTLSTNASAPDGGYAVRARFVDAVGNVSAVVSDSTYLDRTAPTLTGRVTPQVDVGSQVTTNGTVGVLIQWPAGSDVGTGIARYVVERSVDNDPWAEWRTVAAPSTGSVEAADVLSGSSVRYRVTAVDMFDRTSATITGPRLALTRYQESAPEVTTTGKWQSTTSATAWGGTRLSTTDTGATMRIRFIGRAIYWVAPRGGARGEVEIYVDNKLIGTIDLALGSGDRAIAFWYVFADTGDHTLKIRCTEAGVETDGFVVARW
jgi:hypothetical protein